MKNKTALIFGALACLLLAGPTLAIDLSVVPDAAMNGTAFGMRVTYQGDTNNAFVQDQSPNNETYYAANFFVRTADVTNMDLGARHQTLRGKGGGMTAWRVLFMQPFNAAAGLVAILQPYADTGAPATTCDALPCAVATFVPNVHSLTVQFQASSGPGMDDGFVQFFKGTNMLGQVTGLDNDMLVVDTLDMGDFGGVDATTAGTKDCDEFVSTRAPQL